jgi:hypothetical protein
MVRWAGHVASIGDMTNGKPEGKRPPGRRSYRWEDNIKIILK